MNWKTASVCGVLLLFAWLDVCDGFSVGSPRRLLHVSTHNTNSSISTSSTPPTSPAPGSGFASASGSGSGSGSGPIGNWFRCARGFSLVVFTVREIYTTTSVSNIFSLETGELIGTAEGNCPPINGTMSPTGSGDLLQECVYTYNFFNRGQIVATGTYDPAANGISNNAATGIDGEFFQALGVEHLENFPDGNGGNQTFYMCEVNIEKE